MTGPKAAKKGPTNIKRSQRAKHKVRLNTSAVMHEARQQDEDLAARSLPLSSCAGGGGWR